AGRAAGREAQGHDEGRQHHDKDHQRAVLAVEESHGAFLDGAGDLAHALRARVAGRDLPDQHEGEQQRGDPGRGRQEDPLLHPVPPPSYMKMAISKEVRKKAKAMMVVRRSSRASRPRRFPNMASAPPAMAPDSPAARPDCSSTTAMIPSEASTCSTSKRIFKARRPLESLYSQQAT